MKATTMNTDSTIHELMQMIGRNAREAASLLASASTEAKNRALLQAAALLRNHTQALLAANKEDIQAAEKAGLSNAMIDRLLLNPARIEGMAAGLEAVAALADPVGTKLTQWQRPNGLSITRVSVPLGVIGIIYESRPNVTADAAALALKSGNAIILRGGSESFHSSSAIATLLQQAAKEAGLPENAIQLVPVRDREAVGEMLRMTDSIDVIIPRGGEGLTKRVAEESRVPTLLHLTGNCHTYIHKQADIAMARNVVLNAKMRRTGICGATESLVVDAAIAPKIVPLLVEDLAAKECEIRGDLRARALDSRIKEATEDDWGTEYLDAIVSLKIVDTLEEAIHHINHYGSHHTDAIITASNEAAHLFTARVDSAIVVHNASTQFADGGEFGMGAEIGIATGKLHARGPVGVEQLTTYKYVVEGDGQTRAG